MPVAVAGFVGGIGALLGGTFGVALGWAGALAVGSSVLALTFVSARRATDLNVPVPRPSARNVLARTTVGPRILCYGETVVGGVVTYNNSYGDELRTVVLEIAHTTHEIEGYVGWYVDDRYIPIADVQDILPVNLTDGTYQWTASGSGTDEYYLEASGGGDPGISEPTDVTENGAAMTAGTAGSLSTGEWDWDDNDTLGFSTVYVRLSDGADPDSKATGYVYRLGNGAVDADSNSHNLGPVDGTSIVYLRGWLGQDGQAADNYLVDQFSDIDENHRLRSCAKSIVRFDFLVGTEDRFDGLALEQIRTVIKGKKVYDPRLDSTFSGPNYGSGSGSHRVNDSSTWTYSQNPPLIWADYRIDGMKFGDSNARAWASSRIDYDSVAIAADQCDADVDIPTSTTEDRFRCNITVDSSMDHAEIVDVILSTMGGKQRFFNGTWHVYASMWESASFSLDEDDLTGDIEFRPDPQTGRDDRYNLVRGTYIDPDRNHRESPFLEVEDTSLQSSRDSSEELPMDLNLDAVMTETQAQRLAFRHLNQADDPGTIVFPTGYQGLNIRTGDTGTITIDELSFASKSVRCVGHEYGEFDAAVKLLLKEDESGNYADPLEGDYGTRTAAGSISFPRLRRISPYVGDSVVADPFFTRSIKVIEQPSTFSFDREYFWIFSEVDSGSEHWAELKRTGGEEGGVMQLHIKSGATVALAIAAMPFENSQFFEDEVFRLNFKMRRTSGSPSAGTLTPSVASWGADKSFSVLQGLTTVTAATVAGWTANQWNVIETTGTPSYSAGDLFVSIGLNIPANWDADTELEIDMMNLTRVT